jgi:hypothetical protein
VGKLIETFSGYTWDEGHATNDCLARIFAAGSSPVERRSAPNDSHRHHRLRRLASVFPPLRSRLRLEMMQPRKGSERLRKRLADAPNRTASGR